MKKTHNKPLTLAKQTLRTLNGVELERAIGGVNATVGANTAHPNTCTCTHTLE
jgi:hypothetical protein